jgi:hypothetical protein
MRGMLENNRQAHAVKVGATTEKTPKFLRFSHHNDDGSPLPVGTTQFAAPPELLEGGANNIIFMECVIGLEAIEGFLGPDFHYNTEKRWNIKASPATTEC